MIWEFRYRDGIKGVKSKHLEAADLVSADAKARAYVNQQPGALFIANSCEPWLVEATVPEESAAAASEEPVGKPSQKEQKERLKEHSAKMMAGTGVGSSVKSDTGRVGA